jgi:uncharacterized short protein YbdD (DUF466 family)
MTSLSAIQIQALVRDMDTSFRKYRELKEQNPQEWATKIKEENLKLFNEFPTVYNMHMNGTLDHTFFDMLALKRKIEKGELTEDQASVIIGQKLFNKYVDPVIKNIPGPPTMSYSQYYKEETSGLD